MKNYLVAVLFSSFVFACANPSSHDGGGQDGGTEVDAGGTDGSSTLPDGGDGWLLANVSYALQRVSPNEALKPNTRYDLTFELNIHSGLDAQFQLVPRINPGWAAVVKDSDMIQAVDSAVKGFKVTKVITVTTGAAGAAKLVLNLNCARFSQFNSSSQPTPLVVGEVPAIPPSDFQFVNASAFGPHGFRDNTLLVYRHLTKAKITLNVVLVFWTPGIYQVSAPTAIPWADWQPEGPSEVIPINGMGATKIISIQFNPKSKDDQVEAADGQVSFTITSVDGHYSVPFSADIRVVDAWPSLP